MKGWQQVKLPNLDSFFYFSPQFERMNHNVFLLLGSNLGDRSENLARARNEISSVATIVTASSVYRTAAWGKTDQPEFFNQVLFVNTTLGPEALLEQLLNIEMKLGRTRKERWGSRIIDIDLLFYDQLEITTDKLTVPHPGIPFRRFTLAPLHEIAPQFRHPVLNRTIQELLDACADPMAVEKEAAEG